MESVTVLKDVFLAIGGAVMGYALAGLILSLADPKARWGRAGLGLVGVSVVASAAGAIWMGTLS
jgi:hypothetical protein